MIQYTDETIVFENVILETVPFARQLIYWCKKHPEFRDALKITHPERFLHVGTAIISYPKSYPDDEVIGVYAYDYMIKNPKFKQDFIVNLNKTYKEFLLFTKNPNGYSTWVRPIKEFYDTYGKDGDFIHSHYLSFDQLPEQTQYFAERAIKMGNEFKSNGFIRPTQEIIEQKYKEIMAEKINLRSNS